MVRQTQPIPCRPGGGLVTPDETERLVEFLRRKMYKPCRDGSPNPDHAGCCEAGEIVEIVERSAR